MSDKCARKQVFEGVVILHDDKDSANTAIVLQPTVVLAENTKIAEIMLLKKVDVAENKLGLLEVLVRPFGK